MENKPLKILIIVQVVALFLFLFFAHQAQGQSKPKTVAQENIHLQVYHQSIAIGDINIAITSLHYLLATDAKKYSNWQDTLAVLYLQNNEPRQAYLLSEALIAAFGYTDLRMEIKAVSAKGLQQPIEAISDYALLYNKTSNPAFGFEELTLEYGIQRLKESIVTGNSLLQKITVKENKLLNIGRADGKTNQQVSLKAVISNIMGLAYNDLKDKPNATAQFEMALKESPDFELAKKNLDMVNAVAANLQNK